VTLDRLQVIERHESVVLHVKHVEREDTRVDLTTLEDPVSVGTLTGLLRDIDLEGMTNQLFHAPCGNLDIPLEIRTTIHKVGHDAIGAFGNVHRRVTLESALDLIPPLGEFNWL